MYLTFFEVLLMFVVVHSNFNLGKINYRSQYPLSYIYLVNQFIMHHFIYNETQIQSILQVILLYSFYFLVAVYLLVVSFLQSHLLLYHKIFMDVAISIYLSYQNYQRFVVNNEVEIASHIYFRFFQNQIELVYLEYLHYIFLEHLQKSKDFICFIEKLTGDQLDQSLIYRYVAYYYWLLHFFFESLNNQNFTVNLVRSYYNYDKFEKFYRMVRSFQNNNNIITNSLYRIMSIIISKCEEICNSPLNNSKAKMLYTFSKQPRFHRSSKILCDKLYDLPSSKNSRAAGFGYGNKYDFTKDVPTSPSPNTYLINSIFENNKKGFGFGEGRQEMETTGMMANIKSKNTPGPGTYQLNSTLNKIAFTLKDRTKLQNVQVNKVPGPGRYEQTFSMNKTGQYFLSKHNNSRATVFNSKSSQRFKYKQNKVPGPGNYNLQNISMSPLGEYYNSKFHGSQVRTFGHQMRRTESSNKQTPGPGFYKLPSEFGYYISKCAYKTQENNQQSKDKIKKTAI